MQFTRHNFYHNFSGAAKYDKPIAWKILANEINELVLDEPVKIANALNQVGITTQPTAGASKLSALTLNTLLNKKEFAPILTGLISQRHTNEYVNSGGGVYDKVTGNDTETVTNIDAVLNDTSVTKDAAAKIVADDLKAKQVQKGLKTHVSIGKVIIVGLLITGVIWGACQLFSNKTNG